MEAITSFLENYLTVLAEEIKVLCTVKADRVLIFLKKEKENGRSDCTEDR